MVYLDPGLSGPQFVQLFVPVLSALKALGGSARPAEVRDQIAEDLALSDVDRGELLDSGTPRFDNLVAWARFYLAKAGLIDSSRRGVWTLTQKGMAADLASHNAAVSLFQAIHSRFAELRRQKAEAPSDETEEETLPGDGPDDHRQQVLQILRDLPAEGFERFGQRLLRECGFQEVAVTGRSGDGGIDGIGILQVNALVSFKVLFQCKRYKDRATVSPSHVRDFRGAMMGRADKGIIITTGSFTTEARREAIRDGVPPIELVDSGKLLDMLEELELGLKPVQAYEVEEGFFEEFDRKDGEAH